VTVRNFERGSIRSHSVGNSLWKGLWTCRKTNYVRNMAICEKFFFRYQVKKRKFTFCANQMQQVYSLGAVVNIVTQGHISLIDYVSRSRFHNVVLLA